MIYSFKAIVWRLVFVYVFVQSVHADIFGEFARTTGTDPAFVRMGTTYIPQYLGRDGNGYVGRFRFGEKTRRIHGNETCANDDTLQCFIKHRKMDKDEYREFNDMSLFFRKEGANLLYKVVMEQTFPRESQARDRAAIMNGVIKDCKQCYGLLLNRTVACDGRIVYLCADDVFELRMELSGMKDGRRRLLLSVINKKVRDGSIDAPFKSQTPLFNADRDIEISI